VQSVNPNLASLEELRADMKKYLDARANYSARQQAYREIADEMLKKVDFPVPPRMLEDYLDRMAQDGLKSSGGEADEEKLKEFKEKYRTAAIWNLRWHLLRSRIIREKELKVEKQEFKQEIERLAVLEKTSAKDYESRLTSEQRQGLQDDLMERKVYDFLFKEAQTIPKTVSIAEFEGRTDASKIQTV
jgi:trigger factor